MRSPTAALTWEIWRQNRLWAIVTVMLLVIGEILALMNGTADDSNWDAVIASLIFTLGGLAMLFVFGMFHYTELDPGTGSAGFPRRLFTLPVNSFRLVATPLLLGVGSIGVVFVITSTWRGELNIVSAVEMAAFMVVYQTILWTCARLGAFRSIFIGAFAILFIYMEIRFDRFREMPATPDSYVCLVFVAVALGAFAVSWLHVSTQRSGGIRKWIRLGSPVEAVANALPRRTRAFRSAAAAQFWLEWRRSGVVLPICVGSLLVVGIAPFCWYLRTEGDITVRILVTILTMPPLLAWPVGKGFSKPDFWSKELTLPAFLAVRPLSNRDFVFVKMKTAAASVGVAWLMTLLFVGIWLPFIANRDALRGVHSSLESVYPGMSVGVVALSVFTLIAATWRALVAGLWIGVSGNRKLFVLSALPYALAPVVLALVVIVIEKRRFWIRWFLDNMDTILPTAAILLLVAAVAKIALAIRASGRIGHLYGMLWLGATGLLVVFGLLLSEGFGLLLPRYIAQIRNLLVLIAVLFMPLARLGFASSLFEKNRHR